MPKKKKKDKLPEGSPYAGSTNAPDGCPECGHDFGTVILTAPVNRVSGEVDGRPFDETRRKLVRCNACDLPRWIVWHVKAEQ